mmetsp:Transcript_73521/g.229353  ORF Transcript_73521/g.229353 Transcript_73521/m.229353 type:complete len:259 (-) Transcript_73521:76-852(-)
MSLREISKQMLGDEFGEEEHGKELGFLGGSGRCTRRRRRRRRSRQSEGREGRWQDAGLSSGDSCSESASGSEDCGWDPAPPAAWRAPRRAAAGTVDLEVISLEEDGDDATLPPADFEAAAGSEAEVVLSQAEELSDSAEDVLAMDMDGEAGQETPQDLVSLSDGSEDDAPKRKAPSPALPALCSRGASSSSLASSSREGNTRQFRTPVRGSRSAMPGGAAVFSGKKHQALVLVGAEAVPAGKPFDVEDHLVDAPDWPM